jgi:hypothetical protein
MEKPSKAGFNKSARDVPPSKAGFNNSADKCDVPPSRVG